ncbi:MAG: stage II sporulation protein P [Clostridium butyricum]|nr:stage II sporulation protein P [Clostridium butyricum]
MNQIGKKRIKQKSNNKTKEVPNILIVILLIITTMFFVRVYEVLKNNNERGAFAYVQLLNLGVPIIETQVYDEGSYAENKTSLKYIVMEAIGVNYITSKNILNKEMSLFNMFPTYGKDENNTITFNSYTINEDSISKINLSESTIGDQIYNPALKKQIDVSKPEILIYHTHTHENYSVDEPDSVNQETNVVGVGEVLAKDLEERYGIAVIHDKTDHCISYNDSYARSSETVDKYLNKYGDFKLIIDIHRDSITNKNITTTEIYGKSASRISFVTAKNSERYSQNAAITENIFNKTKELFPTLPREITTYPRGKNAFNQSKSDNSVLFEIGSHYNTPEESQVTGECMARVIAEILNKKE